MWRHASDQCMCGALESSSLPEDSKLNQKSTYPLIYIHSAQTAFAKESNSVPSQSRSHPKVLSGKRSHRRRCNTSTLGTQLWQPMYMCRVTVTVKARVGS
jgi:hypothetical protein